MKVSKFFNTDYIDQASYDNLRKIASAIDGQKNTSRKILYTVLDKNISSEIKVSQLSSKMAEHAEYLHGDASGVIVTMAQNYPGTNNMPLLAREGNFGTRFKPDASAPRYIYTHKESYVDQIFNPDDVPILVHQYFEGTKIEPRYFLPSIPMLLINGSEGVSSGHAQKIQPRNPAKIKQHLVAKLQGKSPRYTWGTPHFEGFSGTVEQGADSHKWLIKGSITRKTSTRLNITEVPVGYSLKGYIQVLDQLEDSKTIKSYTDKSDGDQFLFEVVMESKVLSKLSDDQLLDTLKLTKKIAENYTSIDENNQIKVFDSPLEIFNHYYNVKLDGLRARKEHLIEKYSQDIKALFSQYLFVKNVVDGNIMVNGVEKAKIVKDIMKIPNILTTDGKYDYLLKMPIYSLTKEKMDDLLSIIKKTNVKLDMLKNTTPEQMWLDDLRS